jgi:hypothetical protein
VFVVAFALVFYLGMDGAGYDLGVRQQVFLVIWASIGVGFAVGVLPRTRTQRALLVPAIAGGALFVWTAVSLGWTESDERTTSELARLAGYLGVVTLGVCTLNRHTFRAAAAGLSAAALAIAAVSIASRLDPSLFDSAREVGGAFVTDRLDFPLDYWNAIGAWGAMACAAAVAWSAHARHPGLRVLNLALTPVAGLAVYLTYSRGGVIATAVAVVAVLVLSVNRWTALLHVLAAAAGTAIVIVVAREQEQIANATGDDGAGAVLAALLAAAGICAGAVFLTTLLRADRARLAPPTARWAVPVFVAGLAVVAVVGGSGPVSRAWDEFRSQDAPLSGNDPAKRLTSAGGNRNDIWESALDAYHADPLIGVGPGTFEFWWEREGDDPEFVRDAHSLYLEQLAELGLPGLLLTVVFLTGLLVAAILGRRRLILPGDIGASVAMCSVFVVFLVSAGIDWMWEETAVAGLALGGIAVASAGGAARLRRSDRRGIIRLPGMRLAIVVGALMLAGLQIPGLVATQRIRASEDALAAGETEAARRSAEDARAAAPWWATPSSQAALVDQAAGRLDAARTEIEQAIEKEPTNWRWPLVLATIQAEAGDRAAAKQTFREGRRLGPNLTFYSPYSAYGQQIFTPSELKRIYERSQREAARSGS